MRTSLRDRIRDPAASRARAHRIAALKAKFIHAEADVAALLIDVSMAKTG